MGTFEGPLDLRYLDGREWLLISAFRYVSATLGAIEVPAGAKTDFASIPRFFWRVLPPYGDYSLAAVVHDHLYRDRTFPCTREEADAVFLEAMTDLKVNLVIRRIMWAAVRVFGAGAYQSRTNLARARRAAA